jgi:dTDP-4-dehydrorhamnose 3,5-epimerase
VIFTELRLKGVFAIDLEKLEDERGFFARSWCQREFEAHGLNPRIVQCGISYNRRKGTLRGMHFQASPYEEAKLVHCSRGAIYDVVVDLRINSRTFKQWVGVELTPTNHRMVYVPEGLAHGFQTIEDNTEVFYQMSEFYRPEYARGLRWNDGSIQIAWPLEPTNISDKDSAYPDFVAPERELH